MYEKWAEKDGAGNFRSRYQAVTALPVYNTTTEHRLNRHRVAQLKSLFGEYIVIEETC